MPVSSGAHVIHRNYLHRTSDVRLSDLQPGAGATAWTTDEVAAGARFVAPARIRWAGNGRSGPDRQWSEPLAGNDDQASLRERFSSSAFMNSSVDSHGASLAMSSARSLVIWPPSTVSTQTCSSVSANCVTAGVPSRMPRCLRPPVQAKIDAIGLVDVFSPFCHWR